MHLSFSSFNLKTLNSWICTPEIPLVIATRYKQVPRQSMCLGLEHETTRKLMKDGVLAWKSKCWFIEKPYRAEQCSKTKPMRIQGRENILKDIRKQKWGLNRGGQSQQGNRTTELGGNPKACGKEASVTLTLGCITYYNLSKVECLILVTGPWASMTLPFLF